MVEAARDPGRISSCGSSPNLRKRDLTESAHFVALLGCRAEHPCPPSICCSRGPRVQRRGLCHFPCDAWLRSRTSGSYQLPCPGGILDLADTRFEQLDERRVRVSGGRHFETLMLVGSPKTLNKRERRTILFWFGHVDVMRSLVPPNDTQSRSPRGGNGHRGGSRHDGAH